MCPHNHKCCMFLLQHSVILDNLLPGKLLQDCSGLQLFWFENTWESTILDLIQLCLMGLIGLFTFSGCLGFSLILILL